MVTDNLDLINELVCLKRDNAVFKSVENYDDYVTMDFYKFNTHTLTTLYTTDILDILEELDDGVEEEEEEVDISDNVMSNFFKTNTKALITFNRKIVSKFFNFKLKRQYRITRYISGFIKYKIKNSIKYFELTILNIMLLSKFTFNARQAYTFLKNGVVYLNGVLTFKSDLKVKIGDNVQILLSTPYLNFYSDYFNILTQFSQKYYNKFLKNADFPLNRELKDSNSKVTNDLTFFKKGVPNYLEVDFLTFSSYVIYTPLNIYYLSNKSPTLYNFYLNRLYNWKFLS